VLRGEVEFVTVDRPQELGLQAVEGAIQTGERHIVIDLARAYFTSHLGSAVEYRRPRGTVDDPAWELTVDATFCALDAENVDRYEPCLTAILDGETTLIALTIMDGPFPSVYPWNEAEGLSSLTSASLTPLSKTCRTYAEADHIKRHVTMGEARARSQLMLDQIASFWPIAREAYKIVDEKLTIRAMPRSGADARLVDVVRVGERALRVRAGKIDAVFHAERIVLDMIRASQETSSKQAAA
jgi:hypothetical protein